MSSLDWIPMLHATLSHVSFASSINHGMIFIIFIKNFIFSVER